MENLSIQFGAPFSIGNMNVRHPKVREIVEYREDKYTTAVNLFLLKPSDLMVQLEDVGYDYTQLEPFDVFQYLCGEIIISEKEGSESSVKQRLGWLTGVYDFEIGVNDENGEVYLFSQSSGAIIDKAVYLSIRRYLMKISFRNDKEKYHPGNEATRKAIIDQERRRLKREARKKHRTSVLEAQISSLVWGNTSGYKYEDVLDLPLYQFYDGLYRLNKIKVYNNYMFGYYSGNISNDNIRKVEDDIDWMGQINP